MLRHPHELDGFSMVCKYKDIGRPWTSAKLADLLEGLGQYAEAKALLSNSTPERARIESVRELIRNGYSMIRIPDMLGLTLQEASIALFNGRTNQTVTWDEDDWFEFESAVRDATLTASKINEMKEKYGFGRTSLVALRNLYQGKEGWTR